MTREMSPPWNTSDLWHGSVTCKQQVAAALSCWRRCRAAWAAGTFRHLSLTAGAPSRAARSLTTRRPSCSQHFPPWSFYLPGQKLRRQGSITMPTSQKCGRSPTGAERGPSRLTVQQERCRPRSPVCMASAVLSAVSKGKMRKRAPVVRRLTFN